MPYDRRLQNAKALLEEVLADNEKPQIEEQPASVSRIELAARCLSAYYRKYHKGEKGDQSVVHLGGTLGSVVHNVGEDIFRDALENEYSGPFPRRLALELYQTHFRRSGLSDPQQWDDGYTMVMHLAQLIPDVDWSLILGVERALPPGFKVRGVPFTGFMDLVLATDGDLNPSETDVTVIDYKSRRYMYTADQLQVDLQASVYMDAASRIWPGRRVHFRFAMVRHRYMQEAVRTADQIDRARMYIEMMHQRMMGGRYPAMPNPMCPWCPYSTTCDAYQETVERERGSFVPISRLSDAALLQEANRLGAEQNIIRQRKAKLDSAIKARIKAQEGSMHEGGLVARISQEKRPTRATFTVKKAAAVLVEFGIAQDREEVEAKAMVISRERMIRWVNKRAKELGWNVARKKEFLLALDAAARMSFASKLEIRAEEVDARMESGA